MVKFLIICLCIVFDECPFWNMSESIVLRGQVKMTGQNRPQKCRINRESAFGYRKVNYLLLRCNGCLEKKRKQKVTEDETPCDTSFVQCQCSKGWNHHGSSCYRIRDDTETWIGAMNVCQLDDGYLAEIEDQTENDFIHNLTASSGNVWLGGSDLSVETEWMWVTSHSSMKYTNWRPTEPNNMAHDENCLEMDSNGLWNDRTCHNVQKYVCEKGLGEQIIG